MNNKLGPKKGTPYGMCTHIDQDSMQPLHWYIISAPRNVRRKHQRAVESGWICLCSGCFAKAEQNPQAPLPVAAFDVLDEDVDIDYDSDGVN